MMVLLCEDPRAKTETVLLIGRAEVGAPEPEPRSTFKVED